MPSLRLRPRFLGLLTALALVSGACSAASPGSDAGPPETDAGPEICDVDRSCPDFAPVWGGGCEGALTCTYESCGTPDGDVYQCIAGTWTMTMSAPCGGVSPPLAERCASPEPGPFAGARLWLSADAAGAPELMDGDRVDFAFGAQGLAMIPYRVHLEGTTTPRCAGVTATTTLEGVGAAPIRHEVRLRCGSSLRIQDILPDPLPCEARDYAIGLEVSVDGVGTVTRSLVAMGGMCPRGP